MLRRQLSITSVLCITSLLIVMPGIVANDALNAPAEDSSAKAPARAATPSSVEDKKLQDAIQSVLQRKGLRGSTVSFYLKHLKTGEEIVTLSPDVLLSPASTTKLVSAGGALALLGKDFRWRTPVVATGPVEKGQLQGDLVLVASGDPNLSQRIERDKLRYTDTDHTYAGFSTASVVPGDPLAVLRKLAKQVYDSGVREVTGNVIVDDGHFIETKDSFVGPYSAACINDGVIDILIYSGDIKGQPAEIEVQPGLDLVRVQNRARTGEPGSQTKLWVEPLAGVANFILHGTIPLGSKPVLRVGHLVQPDRAAAHFFVSTLKQAGVKVRGDASVAKFGRAIYRKYTPLAEHVSPPLSEALRVVLKTSHNLHATMLPVTIGAELENKGDRQSGFGRMYKYFKRVQLPVDSVILDSGSGGGRIDRLSSKFLVDLLHHMSRRSDFSAYWNALPISGVDGTLASRLRSPLLRRRVRAKTGTLLYKGSFHSRWIYLSKSLAGYLDLRDERHREDIFVFAIMIGNTVCENRKEGVDLLFGAQQDLLTAVVEYIHSRRAQEVKDSSKSPGSD